MVDINRFTERQRLKEGRKLNSRGRHRLYKCPAGKWTIGYGRNLEDRGLSEQEANLLLKNDILSTLNECTDHFSFYGQLDSVRAAVVAEMVFNMGLPTFQKFRKTILALSLFDFEKAADEMVESLWYRQTGSRARELVYAMRKGEFES